MLFYGIYDQFVKCGLIDCLTILINLVNSNILGFSI